MEIELPNHIAFIYLFFLFINSISLVGFLQVSLLFLLLIVSGLVSGSEVAFFSLNATDIKSLKSNKKKSLKKIHELLKTPEKLLATILILNNLINVAIITLSAYFTWNTYGKDPLIFLILTIVVTLFIVFFGEIIPKVYANKNKLFFVKISSKIIIYSFLIFKPLVYFLVFISKVLKNLKKKNF